MSTSIITRPPRQPGPALPQGELELQEPPALPEVAAGDMSAVLMYLPMGLGSGATVLLFASPSAGPMSYIASGLMALSTVGMLFGQMGRATGERKRRLKGERRDYLRYLTQMRRQVRQALGRQRAAATWDHPDPTGLWAIAMGPRLWERRPGHTDFGEVRIGLGDQRSQVRLVPPQTKPVEDLEPLCASALRRFIRAYSTASGMPVVLHLPGLPSIGVTGPTAEVRAVLRAMVAQLVTFHSPDDLKIAVLVAPDSLPDWEWVKWLPHNAHPTAEDAAGPVRLVADDCEGLVGLLGTALLDRPGFDAAARPSAAEPLLVLIADGVAVPQESRFLRGGFRNAVVIEAGARHGLRVVVGPERLELVGDAGTTLLGAPDALTPVAAQRLARLVSPLRVAGAVEAAEPLEADFDLTRLLGIQDAASYDVRSLWQARARWGKLRVPIGLGADGSMVELDIKESAQGGMGPHGMVIGATGSGKSELLRTLVIALAATHSSETLNLVLTDFKGGATFMGMEALPHTSAVITNLADELPLVDRMQDALHGELIRRQELLRDKGYSSLVEYEKARAGGTLLEPLPTLFIVVDEFSELLASKPEFMDLFVMIGRLGRSLGVHLLLASQRLDEGRIHQLESHLSYRIALRTFSSMESRSVIGVSDAYELPSSPGNGFLKIDTQTLVRFKAGYVSGPLPESAGSARPGPKIAREVIRFDTRYRAPRLVPTVGPGTTETAREQSGKPGSVLETLISRLRGQGPAARQVWLPPLSAPPGLDELLPGLSPHGARGLTAPDWPACGRLQAPVALVDRPFEQRRDLLTADLAGAQGHVGVVGAPRAGKSTLLRTLVLSLALTHTAEEAQFYCLDFGGGALGGLSGLPHVGSVAARLDRDRVRRTVAEMLVLLEQREQRFAQLGVESMADYRLMRARGEVDDPHGDVFLVIDGWFTLRQDFEDLEAGVSELASRGLGYGVHVVVAATRWSEIRPWLRDLLGTRFELRLGDPLESEVGSRAAAGVPAVAGRGLTSEGQHFLAALPRIDGCATTDGLAEASKALVAEIAGYWQGRSAPPVRLLPSTLHVTELPEPDGDLRVALGVDEHRLQPVAHDFAHTPHLMVLGDTESGKTNLLKLVAHAVTRRYSPAGARLVVADFRRQLHDAVPEDYRVGYAVTSDALADLAGNAAVSLRKRMPGPEITPERLRRRDWWQGPQLYLLIDDYDLAGGGHGGPLEPLLDLLAHGTDIGLHVVLARSSNGGMRAMMDPVLNRLWELGTPGLLLSCAKDEGKFLGDAQPRQLPPGRAQLVTRRGSQLVHTALAPELSTVDGEDR
ncbi:type VII secretion protein EccCa [Allokutzneria oryzae]|uniref:Type VII secretion protein EccCa n=1 Tax=Allokutzneria oryzae TaxID=1378989 RepID=A0ABV6A9W1_9PSEU